MSRLAKQPITLPPKVELTQASGAVSVKGPLGTLTRTFGPLVEIKVEDGAVKLVAKGNQETLPTRALIGTYFSHIQNMVEGVSQGFTKKLILEGVGYKVAVSGNKLAMSLGLSHPVERPIPEGLKVTADKNLVTIIGADKELVGQFAADIRALKKPEPYKGKGFRYEDEKITRKQGKKVVA